VSLQKLVVPLQMPPAAQASFRVQALPSSHGVPTDLFVAVGQRPVEGMQAPWFLHVLVVVQTLSVPATQVPLPSQTSFWVQRLLSASQAVPAEALPAPQVPVVVSQVCVQVHIGVHANAKTVVAKPAIKTANTSAPKNFILLMTVLLFF
jgi:hypothetical protein